MHARSAWEFKRMRTRMLSIPHDELLKSVARRIVDRHVLRLIKLWLKTNCGLTELTPKAQADGHSGYPQ